MILLFTGNFYNTMKLIILLFLIYFRLTLPEEYPFLGIKVGEHIIIHAKIDDDEVKNIFLIKLLGLKKIHPYQSARQLRIPRYFG